MRFLSLYMRGILQKFPAVFFCRNKGVRKYAPCPLYIARQCRVGEMLGVLNRDIDLVGRVLHLQRGVKVVNKRNGVELLDGSTEVKVGKLKSATSKRDIPLNDVAIQMIKELREEFYFGEDNSCIKNK